MEIKALVESLLFVADRAVQIRDLAQALEVETVEIEAVLQALDQEYRERGIRLQRKGDRVQLVTAPEAGPTIERFLGLDISGKLSSAALETLSIVAYRQPVTRMQVDAIRGVNSDSVLRSLVRRGLLEEVGRAETVGRPILYGVTFEFLEQFGLESVNAMPRWDELGPKLAQREQETVESEPEEG